MGRAYEEIATDHGGIFVRYQDGWAGVFTDL